MNNEDFNRLPDDLKYLHYMLVKADKEMLLHYNEALHRLYKMAARRFFIASLIAGLFGGLSFSYIIKYSKIKNTIQATPAKHTVNGNEVTLKNK